MVKRRTDVTTVEIVEPGLRFADFVQANARSLFGTAYVLTGDADAAEELLQDTLARTFAKWSRVEASQQPIAYVRRSLVNRFISGRRLAATRDVALTEIPERAGPADIEGTVTDRHLIVSLMGDLPAQQRAAIVLRYLHDLPDAEIAQALGCRQATVRSLISRAVARMRKQAIDQESTDRTDGDER